MITMFGMGKNELDIVSVLEALNDAWNYFPHEVLAGLSPVEMILERKVISKAKNRLIN